MFDLNIAFNKVLISSIKKQDIFDVYSWLNSEYEMNVEGCITINLSDFYQRFLEYYINECEFFAKITYNESICGILKGRVEFSNLNRVWIGCFFVDSREQEKGFGNDILQEVIKYFNKEYSINNFSTGIMAKDKMSIDFWKSNGFNPARVAKNFYNIDEQDIDMLILNKSLI